MGAISEFPHILKDVFITDTKNDVGIYKLRFFIRGKPWVVTIDDEILLWENSLNFASVGENKNLWGPLVEKAFAKMKGNYATASGGFTVNGLRSLVGAPVFRFDSDYQLDADGNLAFSEVWTSMKAADDLNYLLSAETTGVDTKRNECSVVAGHAYTVIAVFELKTGSTVDHQMYMVRNPWGSSKYAKDWMHNDTKWTDDYLSQVPYGIDPTTSHDDGVFFIEDKDFLTCF